MINAGASADVPINGTFIIGVDNGIGDVGPNYDPSAAEKIFINIVDGWGTVHVDINIEQFLIGKKLVLEGSTPL